MRKEAFGLIAVFFLTAQPVHALAGDGLAVLGLEPEPPRSAPVFISAPSGGRGTVTPVAAPEAATADLPEAAPDPTPAPLRRKTSRASRTLPPIEATGPPAPAWGTGGSGARDGWRSAPAASGALEPVLAVSPQQQSAAPSILPQQAPTVASAPTDENEPAAAPDPQFQKQQVAYSGPEAAGSVVIDTGKHFLFLVEPNGQALRYGVGVGRPGFEWAGVKTVTRKAEWPEWIPPDDMLKRRPDLPKRLPGGPHNPLGARALYLGSTLYRIHGTNDPSTIGQDVSSGCIRMTNDDVTDLYNRVPIGTKVVVR